MQYQLSFLAFPGHLQRKVLKWKPPKKRLLNEPLEQISSSIVRKQIETDHSYNTAECFTPKRVTNLTKQARPLQQKVDRQNKRIKNIKH